MRLLNVSRQRQQTRLVARNGGGFRLKNPFPPILDVLENRHDDPARVALAYARARNKSLSALLRRIKPGRTAPPA
jgi:hypothetical protein